MRIPSFTVVALASFLTVAALFVPSLQSQESQGPIIPRKSTAAAPSTALDRPADIRVSATMVLIPVTVTDPINRVVTGLEKEKFQDLRR